MAITKVYLMNTLLEKDYVHTMYFEDAAAQQSYFQSRKKTDLTFTDFSYQRKDHVIRVPRHVDSLFAAKVNYCMYQNTEYSNKWFYAFVTDMKYIDDGRTDVYIQTDCIQTWMFDITIKHSFVEREHAETDEIGQHTIDEGLEMGEYIANVHTKANYASGDLVIVIGTTKTPDGENVNGILYNNIYSGVRYYSFDANSANDVNEFLSSYDQDGAGEAITCMFLAPKQLAGLRDNNTIAGTNTPDTHYINNSGAGGTASSANTVLAMTSNDLNGYTPKNAKLMCYPYRYLLVSNNAGTSVPFKYEQFYTGNAVRTLIPPEFVIEGVLTPGCSVRMTPLHYNGIARNDDAGINMGKFPILNWTSDVYTNWLTQNGVNIAVQVASGVGQIVAGAAMAIGTGGMGAAMGGGSIVGGVTSIASTLSQIHQQSFAPPQAKGNTNAGDAVTAADQNDFHFYDMTIKAEYAKIIDEYFEMFGYKCHRVKVPAKNHRQNHWYTKTIDANIIGGIPQDDLQIIKDCYNKGITFWKNETYYRNYSAPNGVVI